MTIAGVAGRKNLLMLFNSFVFIAVFFPIVFLGFFRIGKYSHSLASLWLAASSLFFYGWWDIRYVSFLLGSIAFNYAASYLIGHKAARRILNKKTLLTVAIAINLILLGYFKYANFFVTNLNELAGTAFRIGDVMLPLGISFFTFTQIAFLVDTYLGKVKEFNFVHYTMFVTYFPHLIAGPVLHHKEMMPQFAKRNVCHINWENVAAGLSIFVLGLAKKVLIADSLADISAPIFSAAAAGGQPMLIEAWTGALAYTLQLYFDFSAYSDMAIGLSLMFNVRLPMNFNSPYKAHSIIEFWRRWHMSLSRFLRDYLYIPLGGSRNGKARRYINLMITMILGGLWHGAGWTFVIWGGLHGIYLVMNHGWRDVKDRLGWGDGGKLAKLTAGFFTFLLVVVAWVFFRADSLSSAMSMLHGMVGMNGMLDKWIPLREELKLIIPALMFTFLLPNIRQIFRRNRVVYEDINESQQLVTEDLRKASELMSVSAGSIREFLVWKPTVKSAVVFGAILFVSLLIIGSSHESPFLYFQF